MDVLASLCAKPARLVIGLMSGTSADGVDAALCRIHGSGTDTRVEQLAFVCQPYPARRDGAHWPKTGGCLLSPRADAG